MDTIKIIDGNTADAIWQQVTDDFGGADMLEYHAVLQQTNTPQILLEMEIDPGGGFEGGYAMTRLSAPVQTDSDFRFALHHEGFLDKAGKLFGMEDKTIGYPEFDKALIVKTNNEARVKQLFADASARQLFQSLENFNLHIVHAEEGSRLELEIESGITDVAILRSISEAFEKVLMQVGNEQQTFVNH